MFDFLKTQKDQPAGRVSPDRSVVEIGNAKARLGKELRAVLYLYADKKFIVSATSGIVESGPPVVLDVSASDAQIGLAVCDKLLDTYRHDPGNLRDYKQSDWQVLKVSGAKSGKQFEENSMYMRIETINSALDFQARYRVSLQPAFHAGATLSNAAEHEQIGATVRRLVTAVKALRDADIL